MLFYTVPPVGNHRKSLSENKLLYAYGRGRQCRRQYGHRNGIYVHDASRPDIHKLLLYYPVTNACFDTPSYRQFAVNYYLYREGMKWFWQQYTTSMEDRDQITASPLRADNGLFEVFPPKL